ncbi:short chain dehydrogenase [Colletotrichum graminicola M1.001]|uniref:Short chain dehydrogenase n=1 Tax=Colletotrichum graminicola (strain M1.001 / M2 / FGSC 10212) TaxID=645133 RepID=E3QYM3_COLGM|nr:short chain dehydrogenase [Colletotrichum graminicola M1.001]EFQ35961.1 short chain dehydrogenase [Colletotrichum graminicola M1.001]
MYRFPGVALITGAGGTGIGSAVAKGFARSGCSKIAITDLNKKSLSDTREAILQIDPEAQVISQEGDISDEAFVNTFVGKASKRFGRIDYSISCAGILGESLRSHETSTAAFDLVTNVNYKGSWLVSRAVLRQMLSQKPHEEHPSQRGAIVNIASQLGVVARPAAGVIATPMTTASEELIHRLRPAIDIAPMRRMGTPEEVANAVLFLCSSQSSFIQGHALVVDGGYTIN